MKFSKKIIIFVIFTNFAFVCLSFYLFYLKGVEPYATLTAWIGFSSVEVWALGKIKRSEVEKETEEIKTFREFRGDERGDIDG